MNAVIDAIMGRRSVRAYKPTPVKPEDVTTILDAGMQAPSGMFRQPWHFTVLEGAAVKTLSEAALVEMRKNDYFRLKNDENYDPLYGAPLVILVSGDDTRFAEVDSAIAMQNMLLAAHSLGLGGIFLASVRAAFVDGAKSPLCKDFGIPDGYAPMFAAAIGYADEQPENRERNKDVVNFVK